MTARLPAEPRGWDDRLPTVLAAHRPCQPLRHDREPTRHGHRDHHLRLTATATSSVERHPVSAWYSRTACGKIASSFGAHAQWLAVTDRFLPPAGSLTFKSKGEAGRQGNHGPIAVPTSGYWSTRSGPLWRLTSPKLTDQQWVTPSLCTGFDGARGARPPHRRAREPEFGAMAGGSDPCLPFRLRQAGGYAAGRAIGREPPPRRSTGFRHPRHQPPPSRPCQTMAMLGELIVHGEDIRKPLGHPPRRLPDRDDHPGGPSTTRFPTSSSWPKGRITGLRLLANDGPFTTGSGPPRVRHHPGTDHGHDRTHGPTATKLDGDGVATLRDPLQDGMTAPQGGSQPVMFARDEDCGPRRPSTSSTAAADDNSTPARPRGRCGSGRRARPASAGSSGGRSADGEASAQARRPPWARVGVEVTQQHRRRLPARVAGPVSAQGVPTGACAADPDSGAWRPKRATRRFGRQALPCPGSSGKDSAATCRPGPVDQEYEVFRGGSRSGQFATAWRRDARIPETYG